MAKKDNSSDIKKNYQEALKYAEQLTSETKRNSEFIGLMKGAFNDITTSLIGMSGADFFKEIPKTTKDLAQSAKEITKIKEKLKEADRILANDFLKHSNELFKNFTEVGKTMKSTTFPSVEEFIDGLKLAPKQIEALNEKLKNVDVSDMKKELNKIKDGWKDVTSETGLAMGAIDPKIMDKIIEQQQVLITKGDDLRHAFGGNEEVFKDLSANFDKYLIEQLVTYGEDIEGFLKKTGKEGKEMLTVIAAGNVKLSQSVELNKKITESYNDQVEVLKKQTKEQFSLRQGFEKMQKNLAMGIKDFIFAYDGAISEAQTSTGIMFKQNSAAMADLTSKTASMGMAIGDTTKMMEGLGDELHTTDFGTLSKATKDFSAISGAMGASVGDISKIAGEMMIMGNSSESVKESFQETNVLAKQLGVNSKKVVQQIEKNITKMREFGFTGGMKSLANMAAEAERLRINVDEIFNVAKRARTIEGAMSMAAELQLAGGSFANINPMDLLSAARKGPEELGKILTTMGGDIGKFAVNAEGDMAMAFDATDVDRLSIVAEATGMSLDALQNVITKNAEDNHKMKFFGDNMFDFPDMDDKQKKMLSSLTDIGKDGTISFKADSATLSVLKKAGVDTSDLSKLTAKQMIAVADEQKKAAENLEEQNKANASFNAALERMKNSFMAIFAILEPAISFLAEVIGSVAQFIGNLPEGFKPVVAGFLAFVAIIPVLGIMLMGFLAKLATIKTMFASGGGGGGDIVSKVTGGPSPGVGKEITPGTKNSGGLLGSLADGFKQWGASAVKILKGVGTFVLSMGILAGGVAVIAMVLGMLPPSEMEKMLPLGIALVALAGTTIILSKLSKGIDKKGLLTMALAMAIIGTALIPFAFAAQMMGDINWANVLLSIGFLGGVVLGLTLLGALMFGPQLAALALGVEILIAVSVGLLLFSSSLLLASVAFEKLAQIDWTGFSAMGPALLAVVPGLLGFALASMAFANPLTLLGIIMMTGALVGLTTVMMPLASSLSESSDGFATFASNMGLLADAVAKFDVDKFERIASASENMASSSLSSGIGNLIGNLTGANQGKSGGGNQTITHEIILKTPDGRELNRLIIKDNELLS